MNGTEPMKKGKAGKRASRRPTGMGKSADSPPRSMEKSLNADNSEEGFAPFAKPSGAFEAVDPDGGYAGNVVGPQSKPVV